MKKSLLFLTLLIAVNASAQISFVAQKSTNLSGAAEVITVQQPTTGSKLVEFKSAYVDSSVAATITLERTGSPASGTDLTPASTSSGATATAKAFHTSNVGSGTVLQVCSVAAGGYVVFDLSSINLLANNNPSQNFTIRTSSITGTVNVTIKWTER